MGGATVFVDSNGDGLNNDDELESLVVTPVTSAWKEVKGSGNKLWYPVALIRAPVMNSPFYRTDMAEDPAAAQIITGLTTLVALSMALI